MSIVPQSTPANVIRLTGLSDEECRTVVAEAQYLVQRGRADRAMVYTHHNRTRFVAIEGYWGRHFTVHRDSGDCILTGLYGRVLARDRRFEVILNALRTHAEAACSAVKHKVPFVE